MSKKSIHTIDLGLLLANNDKTLAKSDFLRPATKTNYSPKANKDKHRFLNQYLLTTCRNRQSNPALIQLQKNYSSLLSFSSSPSTAISQPPSPPSLTDTKIPVIKPPILNANLDKLLADLETQQARNATRELGDISTLLDQSLSSPPPTPVKKVQPHQNLFTHSVKSGDFPQSTKKTSASNPFKNLGVIMLGLFGLGASIFGLNQFIQNANINFAASTDSGSNLDKQTPPSILTFQGRISDTSANSVNSTVSMRFELYNTSGGNTPPPVGGDKLWDSNLCQITPNSQGVFSVNLGAGQGDGNDQHDCGQDLANLFSQYSSVWLQISINNETLFPRQLIKSVPYALNSAALQGFSASQSATANTIPVVSNDGNLNFNTAVTSFVNFGNLGLVSQTGDIFLLPGSGNVYLGTQENPVSLIVSGDASVSGSLILGAQSDSKITSDNGFNFFTKAGQDLWDNLLTLTNTGYLGLGTSQPSQKLTLNQGSLNFDFSAGPDISGLQLSDYGYVANALSRVQAPPAFTVNVLNTDGNLSNATYQYRYSYVTASGKESSLSPAISFSNNLSQKQFLLSNIGTYSLDNIVARKIYRTKANGDEFYLLTTINDNASTTWVDNTPDEQLQAKLNYSGNRTGTYKYKVSFVTADSETSPSLSPALITLSGDNRAIKLDNIPLASTSIESRKIYRSLADSDLYYLLATINDNQTTSLIDSTSDEQLTQSTPMSNGGGIYANNLLALQFDTDGSIITETNLTANARLETSHGDNQGLQIPTSIGKPEVKIGQKVGDIAYDSINQTLYIYNGSDFIATNNATSNSNTPSSNSYCTGNICRIALDPEYPGAVITGDSGANNSLVSGHEVINEQYRFNYYRWSSDNTTDFSNLYTTINFTLPNNFNSWQTSAITLDFLTSTLDVNQNAVNLEISKQGSSVNIVKPSQVSQTADSWSSSALSSQPFTISAADLSVLGAKGGDTLTFKITSQSKDNHYVKIGQLNINYYGQNGLIDSDTQTVWKQLAGVIFPTNSSQDVVLGGTSTASAKIAFLNLGDVGTPTLYVKGNLFLDNQSQKNYLDLAANSSFNIRTLDDNAVTTERFTILSNGNVGIGVTNPTSTLDVGGDVNIDGSLHFEPITPEQAGVCDATTTGKIYYNSVDLQFYICQATDQTNLNFAWSKVNQ